MKKILILGSTGSVGKNALDVIKYHKDRFIVVGLSSFSNEDLLLSQAKNFNVQNICLVNSDAKKKYSKKINFYCGQNGLLNLIRDTKPDILLSAVVGISGLKPLVYAIKNNVPYIALANKESLITGGPIIQQLLKRYKTKIIPVDSEHSAIYQCLKGENISSLKKLILTASGGPLFRKNIRNKNINFITKHPTWKMGRKISVDSATMINKGFEYIEAHFLFGVPYEKIDIIIHPQSVFHGFVEFIDGATLAMLSYPDMRLPISYALGLENRIYNDVKAYNLINLNKMEFYKPDYKKFPLLKLTINCSKMGQSYVIALNAANEVLVSMFLQNKISFIDIQRYLGKLITNLKFQQVSCLDDVFEIDKKARKECLDLISK